MSDHDDRPTVPELMRSLADAVEAAKVARARHRATEPEPARLTVQQRRVLEVLAHDPGVTIAAAARMLGTTAGRTAATIARLAACGLLDEVAPIVVCGQERARWRTSPAGMARVQDPASPVVPPG